MKQKTAEALGTRLIACKLLAVHLAPTNFRRRPDTVSRERWNTSVKVEHLRGAIASTAPWERWNMVGTDGCFGPALYGVCTFCGVWAKLVRKPLVRSAPMF